MVRARSCRFGGARAATLVLLALATAGCVRLGLSPLRSDGDGDADSDADLDQDSDGRADADAAVDSDRDQDDDTDDRIDADVDADGDDDHQMGPVLEVTTSDGFDSDCPALVWTGTRFGVAWRDHRDSTPQVYFALLDPTGSPTGSAVRVSAGGGNSYCPALAWTGSDFVLAWSDDRDGNMEIYFARLDGAGVKRGGDVRITNDGAISSSPALTWGPDEVGLAWVETRGINDHVEFARLDASGAILTSSGSISSEGLFLEAVWPIWTGAGYAVAWYLDLDGTGWVWLATLSATGELAAPPLQHALAASPFSEGLELVWTGSELVLAWVKAEANAVAITRFDAAGSPIGDDTTLPDMATNCEGPSIAWAGSEAAVVWAQNRTGQFRIYMARVDASGEEIGTEAQVSEEGFAEAPSVAWNGTGYLVTWAQDPGLSSIREIRGRLVTP